MNQKQTLFVEHYKRCGNAAEAAIKAGYSVKGAKVQGSRLLDNQEIKKAIGDFQSSMQQETGVTVEQMIADLLKIAKADIRKLFDKKGNLKGIHSIDNETAFAISEISETTFKGRKTKRIKLYSKQISQDMLLKIIGGYENELALLMKLDDSSLDMVIEKIMKKANQQK